MTRMFKSSFLFGLSLYLMAGTVAQPLTPVGALPTPRHLKWHDLEFYLFMHFGPNTFTDEEWGHGTEDPAIFNPTDLDCRQWAQTAKNAGAKGIIITAKHHDGFCLWPSQYSTHTVRESKWRDGKGDVLADLSKACKEYGLLFGIYISPWDRNHPQYGTDGYNAIYINTMKEAVARYGPIFEMWWDGANGEGPNGKKQVYDFVRFEQVIKEIAPDAVVFSDIGPDIRWVGNERGIAGETNWNLLDTAGFKRGAGGPPLDTLSRGNVNGKNWIPAECDVSIRPGWFYHASEDERVKSPEELMRLYLQSVGRGANFLLNVPPDRRGRIHPSDSAALAGFQALRGTFYQNDLTGRYQLTVSSKRKSFSPSFLFDGDRSTYWAASDDDAAPQILLESRQPVSFNCIVLEEYLEAGQRIGTFVVEAGENGNYREIARGTTVGRKRILQFPRQNAASLRIRFTGVKDVPALVALRVLDAPYY